MKKVVLYFFMGILVLFSACSEEDNPLNLIDSNITALEELDNVYQSAREDYPDAELASIYGMNVDASGEIDLQDPTGNIFVYIVQSDQAQGNEFYVPVFALGPIKSPINFNTMLSVIQDAESKNTLEGIFGALSTVTISSNALYTDSPTAISRARNSSEGQTFLAANSDVRMDMYLIPSKAFTLNGIEDAADWIVSLNSSTNSLVLYVNSQTGVVVKITD